MPSLLNFTVEELRIIAKARNVGDLKMCLNKFTTLSAFIPTLVQTTIARLRPRPAPRLAIRFLSHATPRPRTRPRCTSERLHLEMGELEKMEVTKTGLLSGNNLY